MVKNKRKLRRKEKGLGEKLWLLLKMLERFILKEAGIASFKPHRIISKKKHRVHSVVKKIIKSKHEIIKDREVEKKTEIVEIQQTPSVILPIKTKSTSIAKILEKINLDSSVKILVVEDEDVLSRVLEEKFEKTNLNVKVASDGEEALTYAKNFKSDIIMLDLGLPKIDGFRVLKELKASEETRNIPVVVSSNLDSDTDITRALKLGAVDYFVKSTHPINEIVEKVKAVLLNGRK